MIPKLHILISYAEKNVQSKIDNLQEACEGKADLHLFIDSGAFTELTTGKKVRLNQYIQFIYDNLKITDVYAALDVIGDPEKTAENLQAMKDSGLEPIAIDHFGTYMHMWKQLVYENDYVAIGGSARSGITNHRVFSKMRFVEALKIKPDIKIHGFGITNPESVLELPYYSVDSTSWSTGRFGDLRLWHPDMNTIITWARLYPDTLAANMTTLKNQLSCYGLKVDDYLARKNMQTYDQAAIKSFIQMENYVRSEYKRELKIYLAAVGPYRLRREGFFDYIFSPLEIPEGPIGVPKNITRKGAANFDKIKEKLDKKTEKELKAKAKLEKLEEAENKVNVEKKPKRKGKHDFVAHSSDSGKRL